MPDRERYRDTEVLPSILTLPPYCQRWEKNDILSKISLNILDIGVTKFVKLHGNAAVTSSIANGETRTVRIKGDYRNIITWYGAHVVVIK